MSFEPEERDEDDTEEWSEDAMVVQITDVLDLHHFAPREVAGLVRDYLDECLERGFAQVRIIHGKGIGNLRRTVHAQLERHAGVRDYALSDETAGGWGATIVKLRSDDEVG